MESITQILARELDKRPEHIENVIALLDEGNTVPFIARYRKELHGAMDDTALRTLVERLEYLRSLQERRETIRNTIEEQGKLTEELSEAIDNASTLAALEDGSLTRTPQPEEGMTYAKMLTRDMGVIRWEEDARRIERLIRGLYPWPGTCTHAEGKLLKIHRARLSEAGEAGAPETLKPGTVISHDGRLYVQCGSGQLELLEVQPEGRKRMSAADYLRGYHPGAFI